MVTPVCAKVKGRVPCRAMPCHAVPVGACGSTSFPHDLQLPLVTATAVSGAFPAWGGAEGKGRFLSAARATVSLKVKLSPECWEGEAQHQLFCEQTNQDGFFMLNCSTGEVLTMLLIFCFTSL